MRFPPQDDPFLRRPEGRRDGSSGNVLDLSLLGAEFADFGSVTLTVPASTLDASDFIIG